MKKGRRILILPRARQTLISYWAPNHLLDGKAYGYNILSSYQFYIWCWLISFSHIKEKATTIVIEDEQDLTAG